jgi:hypothetical protein
MDHSEAVKIRATERYLLGELEPESRDQFEEHIFSCNDCAMDLRTAAMFVEQSKGVLTESQRAPFVVPVARTSWNWFGWLRPAFAIPALACLLAVGAYRLGTLSHPAAEQPALMASLVLHSGASRADAIPAVNLLKGEGFSTTIEVPPSAATRDFTATLLMPDGKAQWQMALPEQVLRDTFTLRLPAVQGPSGTYTLVVEGIGGDGQKVEVARYPISVNLH